MRFYKVIFFLIFLVFTNAHAQKSYYDQMKISGMIIPGNPDLKSASDSKIKVLKNQTLFERQEANTAFAFICEMPQKKPCKKGTEKMLGMWGLFPKDVLKQLRNNSEHNLNKYDVEAYLDKDNKIDGSKPIILYAYETEGKD